ncbi:MAG: tetratricopeptide repeat protein [Deltaproteobacteria bacterium]|nr:tetratricopeptide repeat protein [Deltaproteobacteria bacterium]
MRVRSALIVAMLALAVPLGMSSRAAAQLAAHTISLPHALEDGGATADALDRQAIAYLADERLLLAEHVARGVIAAHPDHAAAHNTLGLVQVRRGDPASARDSFVRARELDPALFAAHMNEGALALDVRDFGGAHAAFLHGIELRPRDYDAWISLGVARRGLNDVEGARAAYEQALSIDDSRPEASLDLGLLLLSYGDGSEDTRGRAVRELQTFLLRAGTRPEYSAAVERVRGNCPRHGRGMPRRRWQRAPCTDLMASAIEPVYPVQFMEEAAVMQGEMARIQRQADAAAARQTTVDAARAFLSAATRSIGER